MSDAATLPAYVQVTVEVSFGAFRKQDANGNTDFWSPIPSPFNYGRVGGIVGPDGEDQDAVLLGPRRPRGYSEVARIVAVVRFVDGGVIDDKWICSNRPLRKRDIAALKSFFALYAWAKRRRDRLRGLPPQSHFCGIETTAV